MRGAWQIAIAASLWGTWSLVFRSAEHASPGLSARTETFIVLGCTSLALLPFAWRSKTRPWRQIPRPVWGALGAYGAIDAVNILAFFTAMQTTTVSIAVLTHYLAPLIVALASPLVSEERWRARTFASLAVTSTGLALLLRPWTGLAAHDLSGALLGTLSAFGYATLVLLGKRLTRSVSTLELVVLPKITTIPLACIALPAGALTTLTATGAGILIGGALTIGCFGAALFFAGLKTVSASRASILTLMEPVVAVLVGVAVWGEPLGILGAIGALLVIVGAALAR